MLLALLETSDGVRISGINGLVNNDANVSVLSPSSLLLANGSRIEESFEEILLTKQFDVSLLEIVVAVVIL